MKPALRSMLVELFQPGCDEATLSALSEYGRLIQRYGQRINLVGRLDDAFVAEQLIGGSLQILRLGRPQGRLVDVGSGAGLPGIPLALLFPDVAVTLVEIRAKRAAFLRRTASLLSLTNVQVVENDVAALSGPFDWALARAFKPPGQWLPIGQRLVNRGGRVGAYTTTTAWHATLLPAKLVLHAECPDPSGPERWLALLRAE